MDEKEFISDVLKTTDKFVDAIHEIRKDSDANAWALIPYYKYKLNTLANMIYTMYVFQLITEATYDTIYQYITEKVNALATR